MDIPEEIPQELALLLSALLDGQFDKSQRVRLTQPTVCSARHFASRGACEPDGRVQGRTA